MTSIAIVKTLLIKLRTDIFKKNFFEPEIKNYINQVSIIGFSVLFMMARNSSSTIILNLTIKETLI